MEDDTKAYICLEILSIIVVAPFEAFHVQTGTNAEGHWLERSAPQMKGGY